MELPKPKLAQGLSLAEALEQGSRCLMAQEVAMIPPVHWEDVAARAYEIFCERGRGPGHAVDDWLRAESELRAHADEILARRIAAYTGRPLSCTKQATNNRGTPHRSASD